MQLNEQDFRAPAFIGQFDMGEHLAHCPMHATCKGMYFNDLIGMIRELPTEVQGQIPMERPKYASFRDYPLHEHMRLSWAATPHLFPGKSTCAAYRELGWRAFPLFAGSMIGKVIFGILGDDLDSIFNVAGKGMARSLNPGTMTSEKIGERHFRIEMRDVYGVIDPYYVGVCEGAIQHAGFTPDVRVRNLSLSSAILDIRWT